MPKKALVMFLTFLVCAIGAFAQEPDYSHLTRHNHPRLFVTDNDLRGIRQTLEEGGNPQLQVIHNAIMQTANGKGLSQKKLSYDPAVKAETLLPTIREGMVRITSDAYAYRFTRDRKYLNHAEMDINTICDHMAEWNTTYFLVRAEMAMTFALAYDWLFKDLSKATRKKMLACLEAEVYEVARTKGSYTTTNNWNHVTNAGLVCSALATYENWPEKARALVAKSIESNPLGLKGTFYPHGASPEGPGYWAYAMAWEGMMLMTLKDNLGTDFGLSQFEGFEQSAYYRIFAENNGLYYNYADCAQKAGASIGSWFCAWCFGNNDLLAAELPKVKESSYVNSRELFLLLACSYRLGYVRDVQPQGRTFRAGGKVPIAILRQGWGPESAYLGIKGGSPRSPHGHMDGGSFVYDAYGVRWACEYPIRTYEIYRRMIKQAGCDIDFFSMNQESYRWHAFPYHNRQHSTLTINDLQMQVNGSAVFLPEADSSRLCATLDMTSLFGSSVSKVIRSMSIQEDGSLVVTDEICAGAEDAHVRWNLVTSTQVSIGSNGITLEQGGKSVLFSAEGSELCYRQWPNDPKEYDSPLSGLDSPAAGINIVGYEYTVPAGNSIITVTTFKRIR